MTSEFEYDRPSEPDVELLDQTPATLEDEQTTVAALQKALKAAHRRAVAAELRAEAAETREDALQQRIIRDPDLPVLLNKAAMKERVEARVAEGRPFGVYFVDLDAFKKLNDRLGHQKADQVLKTLADSLNVRFRRDSDIGRFGGDEFLIITVGLRLSDDEWPEEAEERSTDITIQMQNGYIRLREAEQEVLAKFPEAAALGVGLSIGSVIFDPDQPLDAESLIEAADKAMYQDKKARKKEARRRKLVTTLKKLITLRH